MVMSSIMRCRSGVIVYFVIGVLLPVELRERAILTGRLPAASDRERLKGRRSNLVRRCGNGSVDPFPAIRRRRARLPEASNKETKNQNKAQ
jgi:hypothetical protein